MVAGDSPMMMKETDQWHLQFFSRIRLAASTLLEAEAALLAPAGVVKTMFQPVGRLLHSCCGSRLQAEMK